MLLIERAILSSLLTALLAFGWLVMNGWDLSSSMLLIPVYVVSADAIFFWLLDHRREKIWSCAYLALATVSALCLLSLAAWLLPLGPWFAALAAIAGGYFAVRLCLMLVA